MPITRLEFATELLTQLVGVANQNAIDALLAQMQGENCDAINNPLATTLVFGERNNYNSAGVQNFTNFSQGIAATVATFKFQAYDYVVSMFKNPIYPAVDVAQAIANSPWGTGQLVVNCLGEVIANESEYGSKLINSADSITPPTPVPAEPTQIPLLFQVYPPDATPNQDVKLLQELLNAKGCNPPVFVDGIFGPVTKAAVENYQRSVGILVDGIAGPVTFGHLNS